MSRLLAALAFGIQAVTCIGRTLADEPTQRLIADSYDEAVSDDALAALIRGGADVNFVDENGITPLYAAIVSGRVEIVKLLIANKADVNAISPPFSLPLLSQACAVGNFEIVKLLLSAGADPHALDEHGSSAVEEAAFIGSREIVELLRGFGMKTKYGLEVAAGLGDLKEVQREIAGGADVNRHFPGWESTPLMFAVSGGQPEAVEFLLSKGADPNATNYVGSTPLHFASHADTPEIARLLVEGGADVNAVDDDGMTPLDSAASDEVIDYLKSQGARPGASVP